MKVRKARQREVLCSICRQPKPVAALVNYGLKRWPLERPPGLQVLEPLCAECADLLTPDREKR